MTYFTLNFAVERYINFLSCCCFPFVAKSRNGLYDALSGVSSPQTNLAVCVGVGELRERFKKTEFWIFKCTFFHEICLIFSSHTAETFFEGCHIHISIHGYCSFSSSLAHSRLGQQEGSRAAMNSDMEWTNATTKMLVTTLNAR